MTRSAQGSAIAVGVATLCFAIATGACGSGDDNVVDGDDVTPAGVYSAIIQWEVEQQEPVVDERGNIELPVIFVASAGGGTIDIGVQAAVVEAMVDTATIRFADDPDDAVDPNEPGEPVRQDGVMFVVADIPPPAPSIDVTAVRYATVDDAPTWEFVVEAGESGASVAEATPQ